MKEYIKGGKAEGMDCEAIAKKHRLSVEEIEKQEKMGIKIEHEHTPDDDIAAEIARDHLAEFPHYYTYLAEMEAKAKKDGDDKPRKKEKQSEEEADAAKKARLKQLFG
jgi:cation transport ATPase